MTKPRSLQSLKKALGESVLNYFNKNSLKELNYKQISSALYVKDSMAINLVSKILEEMTENGILTEVTKGKFKLKQVNQVKNYIVGRIDMTASGSAFLVSEEMTDDVYLAPRMLREALHGDLVKAFVFATNKGKRLEGEVVEILERKKMEFTGVVQLSHKFAFLVPDNRKMNHDILIPLDQLKGAKDGEKAVARIIEWPKGAKNPVGEIIHVLGKKGENNTEMNAILADFGFPLSFPLKVETESEAINNIISQDEIALRKDFRKTLTFTIDPADAKDFDDAISFKKLDNGNFEIGVHIADVSHYVKPNTSLDDEAYERATSVYLVDRVIPMLPENLSNGLCSLRPKEDKLCFAAVFIIDDNAKIIEEWFGKTIIHSDRRFSYEEVQEILETEVGDYSNELKTLNQLAYKLRDEKFKNGAISFETSEVKFRLDESGKPIGVYVKERKDAHKLIEDFMLLANRKVAEFIYTKGGKKNQYPFVYRAHDAPSPENIETFATFAARFGYKVSTKSSKDISKSLNKLMDDVVGTKEQNVLTSLAIRSMAKAIYTTTKSFHYGLAFDYYTHFTSPIRRYPDVMVHRLLDYYLKGGKPNPVGDLEEKCKHSSEMEKKAAEAERASIKYKQAEYLKDNVGETYTGIISGVTEWGMYVELNENKCEGMIRLRDLTDDFYVLDQKNYCIIGQRKKKVYQLGDEVSIKVKSVDLGKRQIDFTLIQELF